MSTENVFFRLIEKTIALLGSDRFLIIFGAPANSDWIKELLRRFPNVGIVVKGDVEGVATTDHSRIGRFIGPDPGDWKMPMARFRDALVIGDPDEIRLRAVKTAIFHRVRRFVFADAVEETLLSNSIFVFVVRLGIKRIWNRGRLLIENVSGLDSYEDKYKKIPWTKRIWNRGRLLIENVSGLDSYEDKYKKIPWTKPASKILAYGVAQLKARQNVLEGRRRRALFVMTIEKLVQFSNRYGSDNGSPRLPRVFLTIGTVGPGGSERQVVNTALALAAEGRFRPTVICSNLSGGASEFYRGILENAGIDVVDVKKVELDKIPIEHVQFASSCYAQLTSVGFGVSDDVFRMMVIMLEQQPSIVHSFLDDTNIKAGIAAVLTRVPLVVLSMRSVAPVNFPLHTPIMQPGYEALLARPEVVACCNSQAGAADYRRWLSKPELPIKIIENGIDFELFAPRADSSDRDKFGIPKDKLVLGSIMRLTEEKQPMLWARVVVEISRRMPDTHFVLVGDGPFKDKVTTFISNSRVASRVHILGHIKDIPSVLGCFDLLLLTSRLEGLPNVLIEAQAMGVPVVTTPAGGAPETLDHGRTGLVAPDQTVQGVAQACMQILNNAKFRAQLSEAGPLYVREKFSIQRMLRQTLELYAR